jgi:hypothetical protein
MNTQAFSLTRGSAGRYTAAALAAVAVLTLGAFAPAAAQAAAPKTLYVWPGGHDSGTCTLANPCQTVSYALTKAATGATIEVSGTIDDHSDISHPVTITTWPGGPAGSPAVLDGTANGIVVTVSSGATGVTLTDLTIENGTTGLYNDGTLTLTDSTVSGNVSLGQPSGIYNYDGTMTVIDTTVTKNSFNSDVGGSGIFSGGGTLTVIASTIAGNTGGGIYSAGIDTLGATIVADNTGGPNCDAARAGSLVSAGYNLTNDKTGTACSFTTATDRVNSKPASGISPATAARPRPCCPAPPARPPT